MLKNITGSLLRNVPNIISVSFLNTIKNISGKILGDNFLKENIKSLGFNYSESSGRIENNETIHFNYSEDNFPEFTSFEHRRYFFTENGLPRSISIDNIESVTIGRSEPRRFFFTESGLPESTSLYTELCNTLTHDRELRNLEEHVQDPIIDCEEVHGTIIDCEEVPGTIIDCEEVPDYIVDCEEVPNNNVNREEVPNNNVNREEVPNNNRRPPTGIVYREVRDQSNRVNKLIEGYKRFLKLIDQDDYDFDATCEYFLNMYLKNNNEQVFLRRNEIFSDPLEKLIHDYIVRYDIVKTYICDDLPMVPVVIIKDLQREIEQIEIDLIKMAKERLSALGRSSL